MDRPTFIASCSFGKDSIATILLALEHNEPLDKVVFSEVMFDIKNNISGEYPEHIKWIYNEAIPRLQQMGVLVDVVRSEFDYLKCFYIRQERLANIQAKVKVSQSGVNAKSIACARFDRFTNTESNIRIGLSISALPLTNRQGCHGLKITKYRYSQNTTVPRRWLMT